MIAIERPIITQPTIIERIGFILPNSFVTRSWKHTMTNGLAAVYRSIAGLASTTRLMYSGSTL